MTDSKWDGMEAVILAGGKGTRLRSIVSDRPKVLAPVGGVPFLHILLKHLAGKGFHRIVISVGYMADQVIQTVGQRFADMEICCVRENKPLGTGGGLRLALESCRNDHVFVMNGDTFLDLDFSEAERLWQRYGVPILIGRHVDDAARYGRLQISDGRVTKFEEKGEAGAGIINAGCYIMPVHLLDGFPIGEAFSLEQDFLQRFVTEHDMRILVTTGMFIDIGVPKDYNKAQIVLKYYY